jgi:hypothetical protein
MKPTRLSSSATKQAMNRQCLFSLVHGRGILFSDGISWGLQWNSIVGMGESPLRGGLLSLLTLHIFPTKRMSQTLKWDTGAWILIVAVHGCTWSNFPLWLPGEAMDSEVSTGGN